MCDLLAWFLTLLGGTLIGWGAHGLYLRAKWARYRCEGCGAVPRPQLIHRSGCTEGWPNWPDTHRL